MDWKTTKFRGLKYFTLENVILRLCKLNSNDFFKCWQNQICYSLLSHQVTLCHLFDPEVQAGIYKSLKRFSAKPEIGSNISMLYILCMLYIWYVHMYGTYILLFSSGFKIRYPVAHKM